MLAVTAYITRGLQLLLGSSKRATVERAEELGEEDDAIPLTNHNRSRENSEVTLAGLSEESTNNLIAPPRTQDPSLVRGTGGPPETDVSLADTSRLRGVLQAPLPLTRPQRWAAFINSNFDRITYSTIFLFIGIPIYYTTGYSMPAQLTFNVLAYFAALSLPSKWKQFLHPVLVSSAITIIGIWILGLARGETLHDVLRGY